MANIFDTLKKDALAFENVVIKDEQVVKAWAEQVFGKANVDTAIANAEKIAETDLGSLAKTAVIFVESKLGKTVAGSVKLQTAITIIESVAKALGLNFSQSAIQTAINAFVPFVASAVVKAAAAGLV